MIMSTGSPDSCPSIIVKEWQATMQSLNGPSFSSLGSLTASSNLNWKKERCGKLQYFYDAWPLACTNVRNSFCESARSCKVLYVWNFTKNRAEERPRSNFPINWLLKQHFLPLCVTKVVKKIGLLTEKNSTQTLFFQIKKWLRQKNAWTKKFVSFADFHPLLLVKANPGWYQNCGVNKQ